MNAIRVLESSLKFTQGLLSMFLNDLSDADLLVRPIPEANHIAWQLGHLVTSECGLGKHLADAKYPALPPGFAELHGKEGSKKDAGFLTKAEYLDLFNKARAATIAAVGKLSEGDLDRPTGWDIAPNLGALLLLMSDHIGMHAGQFTVVRRKLGKPVLF